MYKNLGVLLELVKDFHPLESQKRLHKKQKMKVESSRNSKRSQTADWESESAAVMKSLLAGLKVKCPDVQGDS